MKSSRTNTKVSKVLSTQTLEAPSIAALLRLLDDPDEHVGSEVVGRLIEMGPSVASLLVGVANADADALVRQRALTVVRVFQRSALETLVQRLTETSTPEFDIDLQEGLELLDAFGRPGTDLQEVRAVLDEMALRVHERFIAMSPANDLTHLLALHAVLYDDYGFDGASKEYYDPANSYLSSIISRRQGIPIGLCAIELLLADRVGVDVYGIAMPYHFVLYSEKLDVFVDAFRKGVFLQRDECKAFIDSSGLAFHNDMLLPVSHSDLIKRMMRNLAYAHAKSGHEWEATILHTTLTEIQ